jgi:hypothetical protein
MVENLEASSTKRKPGTCRGANTNSDCCFYYPFCESTDCGGQSDGSKGCELFNTGQIQIPENNVFLKKKREAKAILRAKRYREIREAKKK